MGRRAKPKLVPSLRVVVDGSHTYDWVLEPRDISSQARLAKEVGGLVTRSVADHLKGSNASLNDVRVFMGWMSEEPLEKDGT